MRSSLQYQPARSDDDTLRLDLIRLRPTHPNHVWSIDFVHDKLCNGQSCKMLTELKVEATALRGMGLSVGKLLQPGQRGGGGGGAAGGGGRGLPAQVKVSVLT